MNLNEPNLNGVIRKKGGGCRLAAGTQVQVGIDWLFICLFHCAFVSEQMYACFQCLSLSFLMSETVCLYVFLPLSLSVPLCLGGCFVVPVTLFFCLYV